MAFETGAVPEVIIGLKVVFVEDEVLTAFAQRSRNAIPGRRAGIHTRIIIP